MELDLYARPPRPIFVLGLTLSAAAAIWRFSNRPIFLETHPTTAKIVDRLALDSKRHLLVVRHHGHEHVLFRHNNDFSRQYPLHPSTRLSNERKKQVLKAERSASLLATGPLP